MEISTFKVKVQKAVSEVLGQEYTVELSRFAQNVTELRAKRN